VFKDKRNTVIMIGGAVVVNALDKQGAKKPRGVDVRE